MKHLRLWCRNESCLQPGAEEKLVPTVSWNTSSPRILSRWRCLPSRYCFSRALALGKVPQCPQATGLQSNHRRLAWHQVSPPLSLWHLKTQYAHHQHYILISQGLFLSVLPKNLFPKNAKTQFENAKTLFGNCNSNLMQVTKTNSFPQFWCNQQIVLLKTNISYISVIKNPSENPKTQFENAKT